MLQRVKNVAGEKRNVQVEIFYVLYRSESNRMALSHILNWRNIGTEGLRRERLRYDLNKFENAFFFTQSRLVDSMEDNRSRERDAARGRGSRISVDASAHCLVSHKTCPALCGGWTTRTTGPLTKATYVT